MGELSPSLFTFRNGETYFMDKKLAEAQDSFIEGISRISEFMGFSDGMGRIYGLLYMSAVPLSLDDICDRLALTKGTVSLYLKQMEERNIIRKAPVRKTRKKYYEIRPDFEDSLKEIFQERFKKRMEVILSTARKSISLIDEAMDELKEEEKEKALLMHHRLSHFKDFSLHILKFIQNFILEEKENNLFEEIKKIKIEGK